MLKTFPVTRPKGEHSERGPSSAHRWRACKGSVLKSRLLSSSAGIDAAMGTVFHEFAAICLEHDLDPHGFVGAKMEVEPHGVLEFDHEMANAMLGGLDILKGLEGPDCIMVVEQIVSLEEWVGPGEFGTTDCVILDFDNWRIIAFDWKYGAGVPVSPEMNDQAILYVLGAWSTFVRDMWLERLYADAETNDTRFDEEMPWEEDIEVQIMIEQPRAKGGGGTWITSMGALLREGRRIRQDAEETLNPDAPLNPGEKQCKFCPAARHNTCEARARYLLEMARVDFDALEEDFENGDEIEFPKALSPEARSQVLMHKQMIEQYLDQLHKEAYHDAEHGRPVPGMKMIEGRHPARAWVDPHKAEAVLKGRLGDDAYEPRKVLSPAVAQKVVGTKVYEATIKRHVNYGESRPILVAETEAGEPIANFLSDLPDPEDDFEESIV